MLLVAVNSQLQKLRSEEIGEKCNLEVALSMNDPREVVEYNDS